MSFDNVIVQMSNKATKKKDVTILIPILWVEIVYWIWQKRNLLISKDGDLNDDALMRQVMFCVY